MVFLRTFFERKVFKMNEKLLKFKYEMIWFNAIWNPESFQRDFEEASVKL